MIVCGWGLPLHQDMSIRGSSHHEAKLIQTNNDHDINDNAIVLMIKSSDGVTSTMLHLHQIDRMTGQDPDPLSRNIDSVLRTPATIVLHQGDHVVGMTR